MKISQAVLLLASSSSAEKVVLEKTLQLDILPSEDGVRSGKTLCNQDFCSRSSDHMIRYNSVGSSISRMSLIIVLKPGS